MPHTIETLPSRQCGTQMFQLNTTVLGQTYPESTALESHTIIIDAHYNRNNFIIDTI